jgi:hypothetical protein
MHVKQKNSISISFSVMLDAFMIDSTLYIPYEEKNIKTN